MFCIVTNNPKCNQKFNADMQVEYLSDAGYLDVLLKVKEYVHRHYCLVTHPLAGSIKPNQIPYRSIVIKDSAFDEEEYFNSCIMIENSIETYHRLMKDKPVAEWPEKLLDDFQDADLSLLEGAVHNMNL